MEPEAGLPETKPKGWGVGTAGSSVGRSVLSLPVVVSSMGPLGAVEDTHLGEQHKDGLTRFLKMV